MPYDVSVAACGTYAPADCRRALEEVLEPLGGLAWVKPGMRVAVKANLVAGMAPERAATTHPALLLALTQLLRERGAHVVIGDSPGGLYTAAFVEKIYKAAGLYPVEAAGAELNRNFAQAQAVFPQAYVAKTFCYTQYLTEADAVINFCKLKSHGMMGMSAAVKNLFGAIPGTLKPEYHFRYPDPRDFARMLVDLNAYFRPVLHIVDAVMAMEGNGPTQGTPRPMGALLASQSSHQLDLACAWLIGLERSRVPTLEAALERQWVPPKVEDLRIAGDLARFRAADFQKLETPSSLLFRGRRGTGWEKLGRLFFPKGKKYLDAAKICCGDIGVVSKLASVRTGDTLGAAGKTVALAPVSYDEPCYTLAVYAKVKGQEDKIANGLTKLNEEDGSFTFGNSGETKEMVISGVGDIHLDVLCSKLKSKYNVEAELRPAKIAYRETIKKKVEVHGRHKKQSGGHGQFGDVYIRFEPQQESEEMIFADETVGGCVPKNFIPSVEKGLRNCVGKGVLAGYPPPPNMVSR